MRGKEEILDIPRRKQPQRITPVNWIRADVIINVNSTSKPKGIFGHKASDFRIVIPCPVKIHSRFRVVFPAGEGIRLADAPCLGNVAEGIVAVRLYNIAAGIVLVLDGSAVCAVGGNCLEPVEGVVGHGN